MAPTNIHTSLSVLVVGAGAVGQVYARHLQLAGAHVTLFVRERHRTEATRGFDLLRIRSRTHKEPVRLDHCDVVTTASEVARVHFDQVFLTVSSTGLRGPWLAELIQAIGDATVVALTPAPDDRALLLAAGATPEQIVDGLISLVSYHAPLPGEAPDTPDATAYWFPPAAPCLLSGSTLRTEAVVTTLNRGGLHTRRHRNVVTLTAFPTAVFMVHLLALETAGWCFADFVRSEAIMNGVRGAREAIAITQQTAGRSPVVLRTVTTSPWLLRAALWFAVRMSPFPFESYVKTHFTKVGAQTRLIVDALIDRGRAAGLPVDALVSLRAHIDTKLTTEPIAVWMRYLYDLQNSYACFASMFWLQWCGGRPGFFRRCSRCVPAPAR
jgi:hypothetical protein